MMKLERKIDKLSTAVLTLRTSPKKFTFQITSDLLPKIVHQTISMTNLTTINTLEVPSTSESIGNTPLIASRSLKIIQQSIQK